jgi:hypothetical protein
MGTIILVVLTGAGIISCDPDAFAITSAIAVFASTIILVFSIPGLIGGIGLLKRKPWARILVLIVGCVKLFDIPIGTALGVYSIWVLTKEETISLLSAGNENKETDYRPE